MTSWSRFRGNGPAWRVNLHTDDLPAVPAPVQVSALDLPGEQKFGLVSLLKAGPHSAATRICAKLDGQGIPYPKHHPHWYDLRRFGYVELIEGRHGLTPKGLSAAKAIIGDLSLKFDIHVFDVIGGAGTGRAMITRCSCQLFSHGPEMNTRGGESRIRSAQCAHIRDVETGSLAKRREATADFLNKIAAPQLPFSGTTGPEKNPGADGASISVTVPGMNFTLQQRTS